MKRGFMVLAAALSLTAASGLFAAGQKDGGTAGTPTTSEKPKQTLTLLMDNQSGRTGLEAVIAAFKQKTGVEISIEFRPGSAEGENLVKTRLAANDMADLNWYNSGSLFQVLNPSKNFVDLSGEPYASRLLDSFKATVSVDGKFYGVPGETIPAGGILYNKKVYAALGLTIPKTWNEFMANCEKIKKAGKVPIIASYKDDWTSQLLVLADYYNVNSAYPNFASEYTINKAKFATNSVALRGFEKLQEVFTKGYINKDPIATSYDMALAMLAKGEGAHYPMLTFALAPIKQNFPDSINDIGFFAEPGDSPATNGVTLWMPANLSIFKGSKHIESAKEFLRFLMSDEGLAIYMKARIPEGPFAIKGVKLPDAVAPAVKDVVAYIDANKTAPALEFLSPIKGPNLPQICVEDGLGLKSPAECAAEYDRDVEKQAKQLMLPLW